MRRKSRKPWRKKIKKTIDKPRKLRYNYLCVTSGRYNFIWIGRDVIRIVEKYSRGRRGAPAKGVGRSRGARVQIPLSPFLYQCKDKARKCCISGLFVCQYATVLCFLSAGWRFFFTERHVFPVRSAPFCPFWTYPGCGRFFPVCSLPVLEVGLEDGQAACHGLAGSWRTIARIPIGMRST